MSLFQLARLPVGTCFNHFISAVHGAVSQFKAEWCTCSGLEISLRNDFLKTTGFGWNDSSFFQDMAPWKKFLKNTASVKQFHGQRIWGDPHVPL